MIRACSWSRKGYCRLSRFDEFSVNNVLFKVKEATIIQAVSTMFCTKRYRGKGSSMLREFADRRYREKYVNIRVIVEGGGSGSSTKEGSCIQQEDRRNLSPCLNEE